MGITGKPKTREDRTIEPMERYGVKCMSMGFLVPEDAPMIWRGPMVMSAIEQLLRDVAWGELDVLVVDMPPGTGDAQLDPARQRVPLPDFGAVIVSTPQDIALLDARKGLIMFRKVDVPVFGIVENMSYFECPNCGHRAEIFSHGGAHRGSRPTSSASSSSARSRSIAVIRETSDAGEPIVVSDPASAHAKAYRLAYRQTGVWEKVAERHRRRRHARCRASSSSSRWPRPRRWSATAHRLLRFAESQCGVCHARRTTDGTAGELDLGAGRKPRQCQRNLPRPAGRGAHLRGVGELHQPSASRTRRRS